ncbi:MAG: hypothetical protein Q4F57_03210 [Weeksellaceae bacterium]|nr:hypothetical protein [Weeksellaceae bacterium]
MRSAHFDCGNRNINRDFNELIQSSTHPNVVIDVLYIYEDMAHMIITIAGKSRTYSAKITHSGQGANIRGRGHIDLKLSDFNLSAPRKMLGLVVIRDDLRIQVDLHLQKM